MAKAPRPKVQNSQTKKQSSTAAAYDVKLTLAAAEAYERIYARAVDAEARGDVTNAHLTTLRMVDEVIERISPRDPFNKRYALTGKLSSLFRLQKGRLRIAWVGSSAMRQIYVIFISETLRKAGDVNDPYALLTNIVLSGQCDALFETLGITSPRQMKPQTYKTH